MKCARSIRFAYLFSVCFVLFALGCGEENANPADSPDLNPIPGPTRVLPFDTDVALHPLFVWNAFGDSTTTYNVYFGTTSAPPVVATSLTDTIYNPGPLLPGTTYYWAVAASTRTGFARSQTWSFVTRTGITFPVGIGNRWEYRRELLIDGDGIHYSEVSYYVLEVIRVDPTWPQQPAYEFRETWANLNQGILDSSHTYYHQSDSGLYLLGIDGTGDALPASDGGSYPCSFEGQQYSSVRELLQSVQNELIEFSGRPGSKLAADPPVLALEYPIAIGSAWEYTQNDTSFTDKEVTGYEIMTVPAGDLGCFEIQWLRDNDNDSLYDDNIIFYDYVSEFGLARRSVTLLDVELIDQFGHIIVADVFDEYNLISWELFR
ncbi:MAG: hypothetical protein DRP45_06145 [Candidatus Zixiibacteriota bacterium]|nr:MAG: hypothetical protein DRP45_06145 [candidate division Zixibacteria bacterium]